MSIHNAPPARFLTDHQPSDLVIKVLDEPSDGGACHRYLISRQISPSVDDLLASLRFQHGPVREAGVNGITEAALLAVLIDRYAAFQTGPHACYENAITLSCLKAALAAQHLRTHDRVVRGVEGTSQR